MDSDLDLQVHHQRSLETQSLDTAIYDAYTASEPSRLQALIAHQKLTLEQKQYIRQLVKEQLVQAKKRQKVKTSLQHILQQYNLATEEGIALMCLAEAFIRIPDSETAQLLLKDIAERRQWQVSLNTQLLKNSSTWGLILTGKVFHPTQQQNENLLKQLLRKMSSPIALNMINQAITAIGDQFIYAANIDDACKKALSHPTPQQLSFDLLGEAALTKLQSQQYLDRYHQALPQLHALQQQLKTSQISLSLKLSSLCPKFAPLQKQALKQLTLDFIELAIAAKHHNVRLIIDAEESYRLEPMLHVFRTAYQSDKLSDWPELGLAIQTYQTRALPTLEWLQKLAKEQAKSIPLRLVKGAYWDSEIKYAQQYGLANYPVFTNKRHTDLSYLCCGQYLLEHLDIFTPLFASHNLHTLTSLAMKAQNLPQSHLAIERLYGMGMNIFDQMREDFPDIQQSVYVPIGDQKALLPYLIRRLLENGANSSFINQFYQSELAFDTMLADPELDNAGSRSAHEALPMPCRALNPNREQMTAINLHCEQEVAQCLQKLAPYHKLFHPGNDQDQVIRNPANLKAIGSRHMTPAVNISHHIDSAHAYYLNHWRSVSAEERACKLEQLAVLIDTEKFQLISLLMRETGKTLINAQNELREAVDFCRYYADQARQHFGSPHLLPSFTGELNQLSLQSLGVFVCISPWNFPVSILIGQITAALAAGNCVIAKPATLGELTARYVAKLFYKAGFHEECLYFTPSASRVFASVAFQHPKIAGVCFTGSNNSARDIHQQLAQREGPIIRFIAETGGLNVMIVDSTALIEQVVQDILLSAFDSAGQRCSALKLLVIQDDMAQTLIDQLCGAMALLVVNDPMNLETDIGPVVSLRAKEKLLAHIQRCEEEADILYQTPMPESTDKGYFVPPTLVEINSLDLVREEVFGPILHILRFNKHELHQINEQLHQLGVGVTLGIHTRIEHRAAEIAEKAQTGNIYINRNMIGAVVGAQPFGGIQLSGTGTKSGGPYTLLSFAFEKSLTRNLTAIGGNVSLLNSTIKEHSDNKPPSGTKEP